MVVVSLHDVLSGGGADGFRHVQDSWFPVVLPSGFGPEQALISESKGHLNKIINIKYSNPRPNLYPVGSIGPSLFSLFFYF